MTDFSECREQKESHCSQESPPFPKCRHPQGGAHGLLHFQLLGPESSSQGVQYQSHWAGRTNTRPWVWGYLGTQGVCGKETWSLGDKRLLSSAWELLPHKDHECQVGGRRAVKPAAETSPPTKEGLRGVKTRRGRVGGGPESQGFLAAGSFLVKSKLIFFRFEKKCSFFFFFLFFRLKRKS